MSSTKQFNFYVNFEDVKVLTATVNIFKISDSSSPALFSRDLTADSSGWMYADLPVETGDYFFVILIVKTYKRNNIEYTVSTSSVKMVELLATFNWEDVAININPMSTVAGVFAFSRAILQVFDKYIEIYCSKDFREVAYAMKGNFYETAGKLSPVISSSPNGLETNSYPSFNFLSNLVYYSVTDNAVLANFLSYANSVPGVHVTSCLEAMVCVAQHPFDKVQEVYNLLTSSQHIYSPSLPEIPPPYQQVPDQWTLAVKINKSGSENFLIAGTAFTVFDKDNKAWVTNNFRQGTPNSGSHCMVFNPDGSAADISPIMGGGILGPGFGVAVNPAGDTIAFGNYGWGSKDYNPVAGSISVFSSDGAVESPPGGFTKGLRRVQGMCYDPSGNLWIASWGTQAPMEDPTGPYVYDTPPAFSAVVCYVGGKEENARVYNNFGSGPSEYHGTFGVVIDKNGDCIVSNAGTAGIMASSVYKVKLSANNDSIEYVMHWDSDWVAKQEDQVAGFEELRQPQVDNDGYIYVGGITSCRVVKLNGDTLEKEDEFFENIYGPWGITIDSVGKKFITGFGARYQADSDTDIGYERDFCITVVEPGDTEWNNTKLMSLPSGGDEVKLANGQPLYGKQLGPKGEQMPPSYQPLMRTTSTSIDRAGNLWCANNWKPSLYSDVWAETPNPNPGGDGLVIFLGVAEPLAPLAKS